METLEEHVSRSNFNGRIADIFNRISVKALNSIPNIGVKYVLFPNVDDVSFWLISLLIKINIDIAKYFVDLISRYFEKLLMKTSARFF